MRFIVFSSATLKPRSFGAKGDKIKILRTTVASLYFQKRVASDLPGCKDVKL